MTDRIVYVIFAVLCAGASLYGLIAVATHDSTKPVSATQAAPGLPLANAASDANGAKEQRDATANDPSASKAGNKTIATDTKTSIASIVEAMETCQSANLDAGYVGCTAARLIEDDPSIATILNSETARVTLEPPKQDGFRVLVLAPTSPTKTQFSYWKKEDGLLKRCKPFPSDWCNNGSW